MGSALDYYYNRSKIWLPMTADAHDPDNVRTLDLSGNDVHGVFGDGSTPATYPTKLQKRGYNFSGTSGTIRFTLTSNFQGTDTWTAVCQNFTTSTAGAYLWDAREVSLGFCVLNPATGNIDVSSGTTYVNGKQTSKYLNAGRFCAISVIGQTNSDATGNCYLGTRFNFLTATAFAGNMLHFSVCEGSLSEAQIQDFHTELLKQVNHV